MLMCQLMHLSNLSKYISLSTLMFLGSLLRPVKACLTDRLYDIFKHSQVISSQCGNGGDDDVKSVKKYQELAYQCLVS